MLLLMRDIHHQGSMRGTLVLVFQALLWSAVSVSGLFTVNIQKSSYEAEVHGDVELVCVFSAVKRSSDLTVIWTRIDPKPDVDVYRLEKGTENHIYTNDAFRKRAQLIQEQLEKQRAVLRLKKLQIKDSGTYRCIVKEGNEGDYKQVTLNVTAPYTPIKKSVRKAGQDEVELSCESQGFPSPQVFWSDGQNTNLTDTSNSSAHYTDEDLVRVLSTLTVRRDLVNNYTCSFLRSGEIQQTASFSIPDEILHECSAQYAWIGAVVVVLLAITFIYVILRRRSHALLTVNENRPQTCLITSEEPAENPPSLRHVQTQQYSQIDTDTDADVEKRLESFALYSKDDQSLNISSVLPDTRQVVLLLGEPGSGKTTVARILSSCWAGRLTANAFSVLPLHLVLLVDCSGAEGDLFQMLQSRVHHGKPSVSDLRETLLGPADCLLILDGYREGNKDLDETLEGFLTERQMCRVLVTSRPGQCPSLEKTVRTVLQLKQRPEESGS
ncbi:uncharacterized protein LOC143741159 isoform X2 [Siphateles boraxobius]|uniref:uncharacterized protein LOC143741159 isoform X2 n=1 Tax=Siphateles boraxobius TaxID=180520 RepID=UPI00406345F1